MLVGLFLGKFHVPTVWKKMSEDRLKISNGGGALGGQRSEQGALAPPWLRHCAQFIYFFLYMWVIILRFLWFRQNTNKSNTSYMQCIVKCISYIYLSIKVYPHKAIWQVECYMYFSVEEWQLISDVLIWMYVASKSSVTLICYNFINKYN